MRAPRATRFLGVVAFGGLVAASGCTDRARLEDESLRSPSASPEERSAEPEGLEWIRLEPAPSARTEVTAAAARGRIYVIGGFDEASDTVATVEVFDPGSGTWESAPDLPVAVNHAMSAAHDDLAYVFGGYVGPGLSRPSDRAFVLQGDRWRELPRMPEARAAGGAALAAGKIYVVGGVGEGLATTTLVFDPGTGSWEEAASLPTPREHLGVAGFETHIYAVGGRTGGIGTNLRAAEAFDAIAGTWRRLPPMPTARGGSGASATTGGLIVSAGGEAETTFAEVEAFDIDARRWLELPPMPTPRHGLSVAAVGDVVFVIAGGTEPGYSFSNANEALDLSSLADNG